MTQDSSTPPFDEEAAASWQRFVDSISPSMHAGWMLRQTMPGTQLDAIKSLMHRNEQASAATSIKLKEARAEIEANPDDVGMEWSYDHRFWQSVFMDSAHSMSAVGMLAPFIESLFVAIFEGLRKRQSTDAGNARRHRADDQFWNPQIVFRSEGPKGDLVWVGARFCETVHSANFPSKENRPWTTRTARHLARRRPRPRRRAPTTLATAGPWPVD